MIDDAGELIRRCRAGDETARAELFERYRRYLWLLAEVQLGKHLRAKCDASDIVQQTMLEAHRDFNAFTGQHEGDLMAWLRRILAHNIFNEARYHAAKQRAHNREVSLDQVQAGLESSALTLGQKLAAEQPSPSESAARHEGARHLAEALARLPADYQQVILLRIFDGLPAEEVAQVMDRTAGAVRMLQLRALTALREEMDKSENSQ
ncbi:MAG: sigma-70 family RNA polymerase sigma factor [Gemmataceae bacterium]